MATTSALGSWDSTPRVWDFCFCSVVTVSLLVFLPTVWLSAVVVLFVVVLLEVWESYVFEEVLLFTSVKLWPEKNSLFLAEISTLVITTLKIWKCA